MSGSNCPSKIDADDQNGSGKIKAKLDSFFAYLKRSYKTIVLIVIVARAHSKSISTLLLLINLYSHVLT
jgi:hypothetical protein